MTNLDAGAIREVERLTREAAPVLYVKGEQDGVYFLRDADGDYTRHQAQLDPQDQTAFDLDSLVQLSGPPVTALYVADDQVLSYFNNGTTSWHVRLVLPIHPAFVLVSGLRKLTGLTQRELVRTLRTELSDYVEPTVIDTFANLRFTSSSDGGSAVKPASVAMDTRITREVRSRSGTEIPEQLVFRVPVYDIPEARADRYDVRVYVEYDHEAARFELIAVHNDLREAREAAVKAVITDLQDRTDRSVPVYYGKPS